MINTYHFEIKVWVEDLDMPKDITIVCESYDIGKTICDALYYADNVYDVKMWVVHDLDGSDNITKAVVYEMSDPDNDVISKILNNL